LPGTLVKSVMLKIAANDGDTQAKLDGIAAKAEELSRLNPDIKVKIEQSAANAQLAVLRNSLRDAGKAAVDAGHDADASGSAWDQLRTRLRGTGDDAENTGGQLRSFGEALDSGFLGGVTGSVGEMTMFQKAMLAMNVATGLGEPLVAGLTVAAGGLAAGALAAGTGLGVFGLVAKGAYSQVSAAVTAYGQAQSTTGAASQKAMATYKQDMAALTPAQRDFAKSLESTQNAWQNFVSSNTAGVTKIMNQGAGLLPKIFTAMQPFLAPTERALSSIISELSHGLDSAGFKSFIDEMAKASGPMITGLATAIGHVIVGIGGILKAFLPVSHSLVSGLDSITAKFAKWGQTLTSHSGFQSLMTMFRQQTPLAVQTLKNLAEIIKIVVSQMTGLSTFSNSTSLLQIAEPFTRLLAALLKANPDLVNLVLYLKLASDTGSKLTKAFSGIGSIVTGIRGVNDAVSNLTTGFGDAEAAASATTGIWGTIGGKVSVAVNAVKSWSVWSKLAAGASRVWAAAQAVLDVALEGNPIGLIVIAIAALVAAIVFLTLKSKAFRDFWIDLWHDVEHLVSDAVNFIKSHWQLLLGILTGPVGIAVAFIVSHWKQIISVTQTLWHDVVNFFTSLWHSVTSLANGGVNSVVGLFMRLVDDVTSWVNRMYNNVVSWVANLWNRFVSLAHSGVNNVVNLFAHLASDVVNWVTRLVNNAVTWFRSLPGKVVSALSRLPGEMMTAGENAIRGFISGLEHLVGSIVSTAENIGKSALHGIESALGIGSPSKVLYESGRFAAKGFELGLTDGTTGVASAAQRMAGALTAGTARAGMVGVTGTNNATLQIEWTGGQADGEFMSWLKKNIRIRGGSGPNAVQVALGQTR